MKKTLINRIKFLSIALPIILLTGCYKEERSHDYLLQHPSQLEKELSRCRDGSEYTSYCDMVKRTAEQYSALSNLRTEDPENFGKQILLTEMELIKLQKAAADQNATAEEQRKAKAAYEEQKVKLQTLFAVVSATTMPGN